ncbi:class I SAM-dependent methyltransferase [Actinomadura namibiensis]|uniref:SAM-dependent methyltransferase n=1 Tax=Actinomadura namibiensis TaxID=182080 RepID=A0A7W3LNC2_ACTNM|nr:class I SAM-dependent methyltransferase [Actinomadura namibiensis]MBA8951242.1 SAM-dependent methyltransferase [Actinomadura namibiensis]
MSHTAAVYSDADAALYPWDPASVPGDRFYHDLGMGADAVLDVGCGTGMMLAHARASGHGGRLVGLDPDRPSLDRARRRPGVEWVAGRAADARWTGEFDLAIMTGHAFQCLLTDDELRASLAAARRALRDGGRFAFETRHPRARARETWNPANARDLTDHRGRRLRVRHEVEDVTGDLVTFATTTADRDGAPLRRDRSTLRFLGEAALDVLLSEAGLAVEERYGDRDRTPVTGRSREIITIAVRRRAQRASSVPMISAMWGGSSSSSAASSSSENQPCPT